MGQAEDDRVLLFVYIGALLLTLLLAFVSHSLSIYLSRSVCAAPLLCLFLSSRTGGNGT